MKFVTTTKDLKKACTLLKASVAGKSTKRIFECVHIEVTMGVVRLTTTDLTNAVIIDLPTSSIDGHGTYCVPLVQIAKLAAQKGVAELTFFGQSTTDPILGGKLSASWKGKHTESEREIAGEDPKQFPEINAGRTGDWFEVKELGLTLAEANKFTGKEAARFVLNGVKLAHGAIIGCDGRRLYLRDLENMPEAGIIGVPKLGAALKTIDAIRVSDRMVELRGKGFTVRVRKLEGTFPDYAQIMPQQGYSMPVNAEAWTEAIESIKDCTGVQSQAVVIETKDVSVVFEAKGSDAGGRAEIKQDTGDVMTFKGDAKEDPRRVGFNPEFLLDFLKLEPTKVMLSGKNAAAKFTADGGRTMVVMPVLID